MPASCPFPSKLSLRMGDLYPYDDTWFLGYIRLSISNDISMGSAQLTAERPYTLQWAVLPPSKLLPPMRSTPSNT